METLASATGHFDAGHVIPGHEPCARPGHGHLWTVTAFVSGELDPTGWPRGSAAILHAVRTLCAELDRQDLNEMLPGTVPSPVGLAGYFLERLALQFPRLSAVRMECSDGTGGYIQRTARQL